MKKRSLFWISGIFAFVTIGVVVVLAWFRNVERARLPAKAHRALIFAKELITTTNTTLLNGAGSEFKGDLVSMLGAPTWAMWDQPVTDGRGAIRIVLTNMDRQAMHLTLKGEGTSESFRFHLLGYQLINGRDGATNRRP